MLRISLASALVGLALVLLAAVILDSSKNPPVDVSDTAATPSASQASAALAAACEEAEEQFGQGDRDTANALLSTAGITAKNYVERLRDDDCLSVWILTAPDVPEAPSTWERLGEEWDAFVKSTFTPLTGAVSFIAAAWLALFVLARLLVETPPIRNLTSDLMSRRSAGWLGWGLLIFVPVGAMVAGIHASGLFGAIVWSTLLTLAVCGVITVAMWLATLQVLRVEVAVDGATEPGKAISAALITARLRELTSASSSIEIPAGPLVKDLAADLKDFSSVGWVAGVQKIVLFVIGVTPWTATATIRSEFAATVTVVRNRQTIRSETVAAAGPQLESLSKPPDGRATTADYLSVLIASEILFALREGYHEEFAEGLAGATSARSVGLQYIAITWFADTLDTADATSILAVATRADPMNQLARYSFAYVQNRHSTAPASLIAFGSTLDRWIAERKNGRGFEDELLRAMTMARAAAARNLAATVMAARLSRNKIARSAKEQATDSLRSARTHLDHLLNTARDVTEAERIDLARIRFTAATLTRACMVLSNSAAPESFVEDLDGSLERAKVGASAAELSAIETVEAARESDLFTTDPSLAYNLATELVCWERQRLLNCPPVERLMRVAGRVLVFDEFAADDPELATADDYRAWKKSRSRKATV